MAMINVVLKTEQYEVSAKLEDLPTLIVACKDGKPSRFFWADIVLVVSDSDLVKLSIPRSDFLHDLVIHHKGEKWMLHEPVIFSKTPSPVGNLVVAAVRPDKIEYLGADG